VAAIPNIFKAFRNIQPPFAVFCHRVCQNDTVLVKIALLLAAPYTAQRNIPSPFDAIQ
jgi:hypothetical protein